MRQLLTGEAAFVSAKWGKERDLELGGVTWRGTFTTPAGYDYLITCRDQDGTGAWSMSLATAPVSAIGAMRDRRSGPTERRVSTHTTQTDMDRGAERRVTDRLIYDTVAAALSQFLEALRPRSVILVPRDAAQSQRFLQLLNACADSFDSHGYRVQGLSIFRKSATFDENELLRAVL